MSMHVVAGRRAAWGCSHDWRWDAGRRPTLGDVDVDIAGEAGGSVEGRY